MSPTSARRVLPPGVLLGFVGVLVFSFSLPATRLAVRDLDPYFVAFGRAVIAGLLAIGFLVATRAPRPSRTQWRSLAISATGVVIGFPLCTSLALQTVPSSHGAVINGALPALTAVWAVLLAQERPPRRFWVAALTGMSLVVGFAVLRSDGGFGSADLLLLGAVVICALGYATGATVSRDLGGAVTICWALVGSLPLTVPITLLSTAGNGAHVQTSSWLGFAYVSVFSMFLGFFAWYAGLARGGIAKVGQVQLLQPGLTLVWSSLVLSEHIGLADLVTSVLVVSCVVATQRSR